MTELTDDTAKGKPANHHAFPGNGRYGMTLRDWFAGQTAPIIIAAMAAGDYGTEGGEPAVVAANHAYRMADAMIAARGEA